MLFGSLWIQEFTRRQFLLLWKEQGITPQLEHIVLFRNEPCYKQELSAARITILLKRKNGDIFGATIEYKREVGVRVISVNRNLRHLYPFMNVEKTETQERILGLDKDGAVGTTALVPDTQSSDLPDEVSSTCNCSYHQFLSK